MRSDTSPVAEARRESEHEKSTLRADPVVFAYVVFFLFVAVSDVIGLLLNAGQLSAWSAAALAVGAAGALLRIRIRFVASGLQRTDLVAAALFVTVAALALPYPDRFYDTLNYHLYLQERPFSDRLNSDFLPGGILTSHLFALGDRAHFVFRSLLGYRAGRLLNLFALLATYAGVASILRSRLREGARVRWLVPLAAVLCVFTEQILGVFATYYIDLLALPMLVELLRVSVIAERRGQDARAEGLYLSVLAGLVVALKVTNACFLVPLAAIYVVRRWRELGATRWIGLALIAALPASPYAVSNWLATGNPVFPYYNSIFQAPLAWPFDWYNGGLGPQRWWQTLIWPVMILWESSRAIEAPYYSGRLSLCFIVSLGASASWLIRTLRVWRSPERKFTLQSRDLLAMSLLVMELAWSRFMQGYVRYGLFLEVIAGVLCVWIAHDLFAAARFSIRRKAIPALIGASLLGSAVVVFAMSFYPGGFGWPMVNGLSRRFDGYLPNLRLLFRDHRSGAEREPLDPVAMWGIFDINSADALTLKPEAPILTMSGGVYTEAARKLHASRIEAHKQGRISTVVLGRRLETVLNSALHARRHSAHPDWVVASHIRKVSSRFLEPRQALYVFEVRAASPGERNRALVLDASRNELALGLVDVRGQEAIVELQAGLNPRGLPQAPSAAFLELRLMNGDESRLLIRERIDANGYRVVCSSPFLAPTEPDAKLVVSYSTTDEETYSSGILIVNPAVRPASTEGGLECAAAHGAR